MPKRAFTLALEPSPRETIALLQLAQQLGKNAVSIPVGGELQEALSEAQESVATLASRIQGTIDIRQWSNGRELLAINAEGVPAAALFEAIAIIAPTSLDHEIRYLPKGK